MFVLGTADSIAEGLAAAVYFAEENWCGKDLAEIRTITLYYNSICTYIYILIPQQRKLTGSSAQNSSGVHWCRHRVRFNEVPEKVPEQKVHNWKSQYIYILHFYYIYIIHIYIYVEFFYIYIHT